MSAIDVSSASTPASMTTRELTLNDDIARAAGRSMTSDASTSTLGARARAESPKMEHRHVSAYDHAIAGQVAGMVGLALVHPLDTVKARLQAPAPAVTTAMVNTTRGAMCVAKSLVAQDGARGLYRGLTAPMLAYGAINAVAFSTNAYVRDSIEEAFGAEAASTTLAGVVSGASAGLVSSFVRGPAERLKTIQQVVDCDSGRYRSATSTAFTLAREHGVMKGIFRRYRSDDRARDPSVCCVLSYVRPFEERVYAKVVRRWRRRSRRAAVDASRRYRARGRKRRCGPMALDVSAGCH